MHKQLERLVPRTICQNARFWRSVSCIADLRTSQMRESLEYFLCKSQSGVIVYQLNCDAQVVTFSQQALRRLPKGRHVHTT